MNSTTESDLSEQDDSAPLLGHDTSIQNGGPPKAYVDVSGKKEERRRLIRTVCMVLFYVGLGLYSGIVSVSMLDLQQLLDCNVEQISMALMCKALGILIGSISGATVSDRYRHKTDLALFVVSMLTGLSNVAIPWSPNLIVLGALMLAQGIGHGTINVICSSVTIGEWGEKSAAPVNLLHTFFSIGTLLAPPTTAPFLSRNHESGNMTTGLMNQQSMKEYLPWSSISDALLESTKPYLGDDITRNFSFIGNNSMSVTQVYIPYTIHGGFAITVGIVFLAFYLSGWEYQSAKRQDTHQSTTNSEPQRQDRKFTIIMVVALLANYIGMINRDKSLGNYNFYIAVTSLHLSKSRAAMYNTVYNGSWALGRLIGTILAKFIKVHWLVFGGVFLTLIDSILLLFLGLRTELLFWILTCAVGLLSGPCYPSVMAWSNNYIVVKGFVVAVIDVGIGAGGMMGNWLGGYLLHHYGSKSIFIMVAAGSGCMALVLVPLQIACSIRGNRFKKEAIITDISEDNENEHEDE